MLFDSNIIIYAYQGEYSAIDDLIIKHSIKLSEISYLETLGFQKITADEERYLLKLFSSTTVLPVDSRVIKQATSLRKQRRMSLGDAIIAATALLHDLTLVTRNNDDFKWITDLKLINPIDEYRCGT